MLSRHVCKLFKRIRKGELNQMEAAEELARRWDRETMGLYIFELYDSLNWYVEHDETNNIPENQMYTAGLGLAMVRLDKDQPDGLDPEALDNEGLLESVPGYCEDGLFKPVPESFALDETWEDCTHCTDGTEQDPNSPFTKMCRWCGGCQKVRKNP